MRRYHCTVVWFSLFYLNTRAVKGLHVNFAPPSKPGLLVALSVILGRHFPKLFGFTDVDIQRLFPCMEKVVVESVKESGYMHIQATKPDTVGKHLGLFTTHLQHEIISFKRSLEILQILAQWFHHFKHTECSQASAAYLGT